jgi:hypothetical protein
MNRPPTGSWHYPTTHRRHVGALTGGRPKPVVLRCKSRALPTNSLGSFTGLPHSTPSSRFGAAVIFTSADSQRIGAASVCPTAAHCGSSEHDLQVSALLTLLMPSKYTVGTPRHIGRTRHDNKCESLTVNRGEAPVICLAQPNGLGFWHDVQPRAEGPAVCHSSSGVIATFRDRVVMSTERSAHQRSLRICR